MSDSWESTPRPQHQGAITSYLALFLCALLAFAISTVCGGGAGLILIPLLGTVLPGAEVPAALSLGTASSSISRLLVFRRSVCWKIVRWFVPAALPAVWLGAWLLKYLNPLYLEGLVGIFLLANLPLLFRPTKELETGHAYPKFYLIFVGAAAGLVSGLTGAVGLLFNRFYLRYGLRKEEIVATRAANELILHLIELYLYTSFGLLGVNAVTIGSVVAVAAVFSSVTMKWVLPYLGEGLFRRVGYLAMAISGLFMCAGVVRALGVQNKTNLSLSPIASGLEAKLLWRESQIAFEFEYDEGFEFERRISMSDLSPELRGKVDNLARGADRVMIEEVFGMGKHYYEAYVYRQGEVTKYDF